LVPLKLFSQPQLRTGVSVFCSFVPLISVSALAKVSSLPICALQEQIRCLNRQVQAAHFTFNLGYLPAVKVARTSASQSVALWHNICVCTSPGLSFGLLRALHQLSISQPPYSSIAWPASCKKLSNSRVGN
jgi:hypothetical protein